MKTMRSICLAASYVALILWMSFIFMMSAQTGEISGNTSGSLIETMCNIFVPGFKELPETEQANIISRFSLPVRKAAHFTEYLILAVLANLAVMQSGKNIRVTSFTVLISFFVGVLYAITDEIHQIFIPGRAGRFTDILIDSAGVLVGCVIFIFLYKLLKTKKPQHSSRG